jgi:alpha-L-fucosidase
MKNRKRFFLGFILLYHVVSLAQNSRKVEIVNDEFIYSHNGIPSAHASTIEQLQDGSLIAGWFGGTHERHPDVSIYISLRKNNSWSAPRKVADGVVNDSLRYPTWNPVLFNNGKKLFLFYKIGPSPSTWWGVYKTSVDHGITWSRAIMLPDGILGPIKNKPITLDNGRIVSPSSIELQGGKIWRSHMEISDDSGETWRKIPVNYDSEYKVIQPTIVKLKSGALKAFFRSNKNVILESSSKDQGQSWSTYKKSELPNPNSGIDAVALDNGLLLMVYNPLASGEDWSDGRNKLYLAKSRDAKHWEVILKLEDKENGEFSYPAIIQGKSGGIHITYTYNREKIKHIALKILNE